MLDLAVRKRSESGRVIALARSAGRLETAQQISQWQAEYHALAASAEFPSVEAGLQRKP